MGYLEIVLIGYLVNSLLIIIYAFMMVIYKVDVKTLKRRMDVCDERQKELISKNINPYRGVDFMPILPYGFMFQICTKICVSKKKFIMIIYNNIDEKEKHLTELEKGIR